MIYYVHYNSILVKERTNIMYCSINRCNLKKNQNAPNRPSEHPPVRGKNMSKLFGGIIGCKDKTSSWH